MSRANVVALVPPGAKPGGHQQKSIGIFQGVEIERPVCPKWLTASARYHWNYITKALEEYGLISKLDQGTLAILCTSYARMKEAEEYIQAHGEFQTFANGTVQLSPYAVAFHRHSARYAKLANYHGLTLKSRQSLDVRDPNQGELEL